MFKLFIENRKGEKISVLVEETPNAKDLVFVMHGLGGFKEEPNTQAIAEAFLENGYTVVRFDTTNTLGESAGNLAEATVTNYYEDLEDVINWSKTQSWHQTPFVLAGYSVGGMCVTLYAQKHPSNLKGLAPIATDISGELSLQAKSKRDVWQQWKKIGWREKISQSKPRIVTRLKWDFMEDEMKYNLLLAVEKLIMPVLMIVGANDETDPVEHQRLLFDKLPGRKELHVIPDAPHTFYDQEHILQMKRFFDNWIRSL